MPFNNIAFEISFAVSIETVCQNEGEENPAPPFPPLKSTSGPFIVNLMLTKVHQTVTTSGNKNISLHQNIVQEEN